MKAPGTFTRVAMLAAMGACGLVLGVSAVRLLMDGGGLARWFVLLFAAACFLLVATLAGYGRAVAGGRLGEPVALDSIAAATLAVAAASIFCTSSLHSFCPFRPSLAAQLQGIPWGFMSPAPMLKFNFAFTAFAFVCVVACVLMYVLGYRRGAVAGLSVLAVLLLVPNDNCDNAFNRPWVGSLGGSPLMFAPTVAALLISACGLCGLWRRWSVWIAAGICAAILLVGIGHMTRALW